MRRTLEVLNELERQSVFARYAIGAIGAPEVDYDGVPTRVVRAEHLLAICLQTGRTKDRARVAVLREQAKLDLPYLAGVLKRHQLEEKWKLWTD